METDNHDDEAVDARGALGLDPGEDEVVCRECDRPFGQITASHLSKHGMTVEEYRQKYPDAPVRPGAVQDRVGWTDSHGEATREKISDAIEAKHERGEYTDADA